MKISELVVALEKARAEHGDLAVVYPDFMMDGCGAREVLNFKIRPAKSPKKRSGIYIYMKGPYAYSRYVKKDTKVLELRDFEWEK